MTCLSGYEVACMHKILASKLDSDGCYNVCGCNLKEEFDRGLGTLKFAVQQISQYLNSYASSLLVVQFHINENTTNGRIVNNVR